MRSNLDQTLGRLLQEVAAGTEPQISPVSCGFCLPWRWKGSSVRTDLMMGSRVCPWAKAAIAPTHRSVLQVQGESPSGAVGRRRQRGMGRDVFCTACAVVLCKGREAIEPEMFVCLFVLVGE